MDSTTMRDVQRFIQDIPLMATRMSEDVVSFANACASHSDTFVEQAYNGLSPKISALKASWAPSVAAASDRVAGFIAERPALKGLSLIVKTGIKMEGWHLAVDTVATLSLVSFSIYAANRARIANTRCRSACWALLSAASMSAGALNAYNTWSKIIHETSQQYGTAMKAHCLDQERYLPFKEAAFDAQGQPTGVPVSEANWLYQFQGTYNAAIRVCENDVFGNQGLCQGPLKPMSIPACSSNMGEYFFSFLGPTKARFVAKQPELFNMEWSLELSRLTNLTLDKIKAFSQAAVS